MTELSLKSDIIFRTYSESNGKSPLHKYGQGQYISSFEDCQIFESYIGILNLDYVLIDIDETPDNKPMGNRLFQIIQNKKIHCKINETDKGFHFFFRNACKRIQKNDTAIYLACGIKADIKAGCANGTACLKKNGKERIPKYDLPTPNGDYDEIPCWLLPIDKMDRGIWLMRDGEGRNSTLYAYILKLGQHGLDKDEIKETSNVINEHIFFDRLNDNELMTILRADAFPKEIFFNEKNRFQHSKMAKMLIRELSIKKRGEHLYSFNGAYFEKGEANIRRACVRYFDSISEHQKKEVISSIKDRLAPAELMPSDDFVCFKNGVLNLSTWELEDFNSQVILFNQIPHNYNPNTYNATVDKAMDDWCCGNTELRAVIEEIIGYGLVANTKAQKSFFFHGAKNNGKSTFLEWLGDFYGSSNIMNFDLQKMNARFNSQYLENTLVNICNDISKSGLSNDEQSTFKQIVTGDRTYGEAKGGATGFFKPYVKLIFSCNTMPSIKDENGEIARRIMVIPFHADFSECTNVNLEDALRTESAFEYLANIALQGLKRLMSSAPIQYRFTHSKLVEEETEKEFTHLDTIKEFIKKTTLEPDYLLEKSKTAVYMDYKEFCKELEKIPAPKNSFSSEFMAKLGLHETEVKNKTTGKTERVYRKHGS